MVQNVGNQPFNAYRVKTFKDKHWSHIFLYAEFLMPIAEDKTRGGKYQKRQNAIIVNDSCLNNIYDSRMIIFFDINPSPRQAPS